MAYDPCDPCCNTNISFSSNETARFSIGKLLCLILEALGGGSTALTPVAEQVAFGSITTGWTVALANTAKILFLRLRNTTNRDLQISVDGGVTYFTMQAGTTEQFNFQVDTDISVKAVIAPISGEL